MTEALTTNGEGRPFERLDVPRAIHLSPRNSYIFGFLDQELAGRREDPLIRPKWSFAQAAAHFVDFFFPLSHRTADRTSHVATDPGALRRHQIIQKYVHSRAYLIAVVNSTSLSPIDEALETVRQMWEPNPVRPTDLVGLRLKARIRANWDAATTREYLHQLPPTDAAELLRHYYQLSGQIFQLETLAELAGSTVLALPSASLSEKTLELYRGRVDKVEGETAYVTIFATRGSAAFAEIQASDLGAKGIQQGDIFTCEIKARGDEIVLGMKPVPRLPLDKDQVQRISNRIDSLLPDELFSGNDK